mgnify:CR=1 FL=1
MQHYTRIRDLREDCDLTQEALCKELSMHKTTYTNYEQGKHSVPLDFAVLLAKYYNVSLDYIAGLTNNKLGKANPKLTAEIVNVIDMYSRLTEKNKGKFELFLEQLIERQKP